LNSISVFFFSSNNAKVFLVLVEFQSAVYIGRLTYCRWLT